MRRVGRAMFPLLLSLLLNAGIAQAPVPDRIQSLREQLQTLETLPSRTPAQEQQAEQLRSALRYSALEEVLSRLSLRFHSGWLECSAGNGDCTVHRLSLSGRATVGETEALLQSAGYRVLPGAVYIEGPPQIAPAPALPSTLPLKMEPVYSYVQFAGQALSLKLALSNLSMQPLRSEWGMDVLSAVLLNENLEVVTWNHAYVVYYALYGASCPPLQPCDRSPEVSFPLTRYGTDDALPPGRYRLRVRVRGLRVNDAPPLTFTLPDLPITVEAPNAR